jgi:uncharacterized protein YkwD
MQESFFNTNGTRSPGDGVRNTLRKVASTIAAASMLLQASAALPAVAVSRTVEVLPATGAPVASQYFSPTGKTVSGAFLSTFNRYGLDLMGYPISEERVENGQTVQYFQRVRMESHPELNAQGYPVLMTRLGVDMTQGQQFDRVAPFASSASRAYFAQTGHSAQGGFYNYWKNNGGVALFGYPISEEFKQDGYTVQWFERARFEYHPELASSGHTVELSLLGTMAYSSKADRTLPEAAPAQAAPAQAPQSVSLTDYESYVLQSVNEQRAAAGVGPVKLDAGVTGIARDRSNDMAARNYFSHTSPEGKQFLNMLGDRNIAYKYGGEILARNNYPNDQAAKVAIDSYLNSPAHKAIMLDGRFNYVGVGHAVDANGMHYFTVIFIQQ